MLIGATGTPPRGPRQREECLLACPSGNWSPSGRKRPWKHLLFSLSVFHIPVQASSYFPTYQSIGAASFPISSFPLSCPEGHPLLTAMYPNPLDFLGSFLNPTRPRGTDMTSQCYFCEGFTQGIHFANSVLQNLLWEFTPMEVFSVDIPSVVLFSWINTITFKQERVITNTEWSS